MEKICKLISCEKTFDIRPSKFHRSNYCSKKCADYDKRGKRPAIATEFKPRVRSWRTAEVGAVTIRTFKRTNEQRAFVKIAEPNIWRERAKIAWESEHGPLPKALVVHHQDRDTLNDDPNNLEAITRGDRKFWEYHGIDRELVIADHNQRYEERNEQT